MTDTHTTRTAERCQNTCDKISCPPTFPSLIPEGSNTIGSGTYFQPKTRMQKATARKKGTVTTVPAMTLDDMLGVAEDDEFNEAEFLARVSGYLRKRTTPEDFEMHFLAFNAISGISDYEPSVQTFDQIDSMLDHYIRTCKKSSQADFMLCDLIIDHWYPDRAARHAKTFLLETRYRRRREQFCDLLEFHSRFTLSREWTDGLGSAAREGLTSDNGSIRRACRRVLALLDREQTT